MGDQPIERRLAAILAADVADYSRLMNEDEAATIEAWHGARALIDPTIAEFGGRMVKHTGDGFLAEFATATQAVQSAIRMQDDLAGRNRGISEARRMQFRIGINLGEITADAEDIHGDGVNIAARLEGIAEPGGIMISANVFEQVHKKISRDCDDMGAANLKNIAEPVHHYRVHLDGSEAVAAPTSAHPVAPRRHKRAGAWLIALLLAVGLGIAGWRAAAPDNPRPFGPPSLAVLPFAAIGGGAAQKAFGAGLTADLITSLSSKPGIRVLTGSTKTSKKTSAQYLFEGSVRGTDKIRITAQLIDAKTGFHLWGGRYDRVLSDPLEQQAEVSAKIVATLDEKLTAMRRAQAGGETSDDGGGGALMTGLAFIGRVAEEAIGLLAGLFG